MTSKRIETLDSSPKYQHRNGAELNSCIVAYRLNAWFIDGNCLKY